MANETLILAVSLFAASSCTAGARMSATGDYRLPDKAAHVVSAESAKIELGVPFTDGVVLQRGREVPVWGKAAPGAQVKVSFAVGDTVDIISGLFEGMSGVVQSISDNLKVVTVLVKRGSRNMPVELELDAVKRSADQF